MRITQQREAFVQNMLSLPLDGRALLVGATGTGKSTLAQTLHAPMERLLVLDPKRQFDPLQDWSLTTPETLRTHNWKKYPAAVWRPTADELLEPAPVDALLREVFSETNIYIYIDEILGIARGATSFPKMLGVVYTQGRGLSVGVTGCTQRPANIPSFCLSESERFYKFILRKREDNERIAEYLGVSADRLAEHETQHSFWYGDLKNPKKPVIQEVVTTIRR